MLQMVCLAHRRQPRSLKTVSGACSSAAYCAYINTNSAQTIHKQYTNSTQTVHKQYKNSIAAYCAYINKNSAQTTGAHAAAQYAVNSVSGAQAAAQNAVNSVSDAQTISGQRTGGRLLSIGFAVLASVV